MDQVIPHLKTRELHPTCRSNLQMNSRRREREFSCASGWAGGPTLINGPRLEVITGRERLAALFIVLAFVQPFTIGWGWGWWKFAASSLMILLVWCWARRKHFAADLGIRWREVDLGAAGLSLLVTGFLASYLIPWVLRPHGYIRSPGGEPLWRFLAVPFQTLNEEMVLRALLLTVLARVMTVRLTASAATAFVFVALHFLLYWSRPPHTVLAVPALATLFLIGLVLNESFLATRSIAIPFGIHLGWNFTRFGNDWVQQDSGDYLEQGMGFNMIESNPLIVVMAIALALLAVLARVRPWRHTA